MKIVINNCYGGFSLSPRALVEYAKAKGRECHFFEGGIGRPYAPMTVDEATERGLFITAFDVCEVPDEIPDGWYSEHYINSSPEDRADPDLVRIVEDMGEEASGSYASLKVVDIPDGVDWQIEEYDGNEWVAEKHSTWS